MPRLCCRARHMTPLRAEIGYGEKVSQRLWSKKVGEGIGLTARQRDAQRLEVPRVFVLERVVSCRRADPWWRTKLNFGSGEPFDDLHRPAAFRTAPRIGGILGRGSALFGLSLRYCAEQVKAKR
jgi:hypothetical protein